MNKTCALCDVMSHVVIKTPNALTYLH